MPRAELISQDLRIFLSEDEVWALNHLEIDGRTLIRTPLTFMCMDGGRQVEIKIQQVHFHDLGDGIILERTPNGFFVKLNEDAWDRLLEQQINGTRYNGEDKVTLFSE